MTGISRITMVKTRVNTTMTKFFVALHWSNLKPITHKNKKKFLTNIVLTKLTTEYYMAKFLTAILNKLDQQLLSNIKGAWFEWGGTLELTIKLIKL